MEKNSPLVSVIITTYKRHDYLKRAIDSVLSQQYKNIELLVIDDNDSNTDLSNQVHHLVEEIREHDERIKYVSMEKNSGACKARNRGLELSTGEFVNFLDDDDEFKVEKIQYQIEKYATLDKKICAVGCFAEIKDEEGNIIQYDRNRVSGDVFYQNLCCSICQTSLPLLRREAIVESGGFEEVPSSQEHLMWANFFALNPYYDFVDRELVVIYHHEGERISNGKRKVEGAIELEKRFERFYSRLNDQQIQNLKLCLNENIINACILVNDRKKAFLYYIKRKKISLKPSLSDLKIIVGIICGYKFKQRIHCFLKMF